VLERNIHALKRRRERAEASASFQERVADAITRFSGSLPFVYLHVALFGSWILINVGLIPFLPRFDPSFVVLAMVASVEAIFLSTFVLISQNRMSATADKRAELDLQVGLLAEHEITKLVTLVSEIAERVGVHSAVGKELEELERDVAPEAVLDEIEGAVAGAISPRSEKSAVPHPTLMAQDRASAALPLRGV
jgi:uncharacterized membrane protein